MLAFLIRAYRRLPHRPRCRCRAGGLSCSELGLLYAYCQGAWLLAFTLLLNCPLASSPTFVDRDGAQRPEPAAIAKGRARAASANAQRGGKDGQTNPLKNVPKGYEVSLMGGPPRCKSCNATPDTGHKNVCSTLKCPVCKKTPAQGHKTGCRMAGK